MSYSRAVILFSVFLLLFSGLVAPCTAAQTPAGDTSPARVAILPFAMNTPANLNYLQNGIRDMLSSRLSWQGKVQVVDKSEADKAARGAKEISQSEAMRIGAGLKADYVLYGSITSTGQSVSIDAKMVSVSGKMEPVSFYAQTKTLDDIMPQVNLFAQQINQKVFGKPEEKAQAASAEAEAAATRNPELLLPGAIAPEGDKISYLNPNFVEVTPEGTLRQPGMWRSQDFQGGILGMDLGDVDGDGKAEAVAIQMRKLTVYKKENQGLRPVATFEGTAVDRFVWVSVVDLYHEGKAYIFLTNLRTRNSSQPLGDTARDPIDQGQDVSSYVLSVSGGKIKVVADGLPYFLNAVHFGPRGKVLIGQKQGDKYQGAFTEGIFEMQLRGNSLVPGPAVSAPKQVNVFNFAKADIKNDRLDSIIMMDNSHQLRILSTSGEQIWRGRGIWGATTNSFEAKVEDRRWNMVDLFAIPSPILIADVRNNGIPEIVLNRNTTSFDQWLPNSMKVFDRGEIVSLSWDNMGLIENWKTRELDGQVTSLRIGDLDGSGRQQLVISMVYAKDLLKLDDARSVIFSYDLNVKQGPVAKPAPDERETVPIKASTDTNTKSQSDQSGPDMSRRRSGQY